MPVRQYKKKPVVIEAIQLGWDTWNEVCDFMVGEPIQGGWVHPATGQFTGSNVPPPNVSLDDVEIGCMIRTLEGDHLAREGDYIIKGVKGEFYPCKPDIFAATYDEVAGSEEPKSFSRQNMGERIGEVSREMTEEARKRRGQ